MCRCGGTGSCGGCRRIVRASNWMRSEPAEGNCGCSRRWGKRRQIFTWGRKKSGARSSKTCADEKGTGCSARRRRWRKRWRKIGESGGGRGRAKLSQAFFVGEFGGG